MIKFPNLELIQKSFQSNISSTNPWVILSDIFLRNVLSDPFPQLAYDELLAEIKKLDDSEFIQIFNSFDSNKMNEEEIKKFLTVSSCLQQIQSTDMPFDTAKGRLLIQLLNEASLLSSNYRIPFQEYQNELILYIVVIQQFLKSNAESFSAIDSYKEAKESMNDKKRALQSSDKYKDYFEKIW